MKKNLSIIVLLLLALTTSLSQLQAQCLAPSNFWIAPTDPNGTSVMVIPNPTNATTYIVEYKTLRDSSWQTARIVPPVDPRDTLAAFIGNLSRCMTYQFRMRSVCGNTQSNYTAIQTHQTLGCNTCPAPRFETYALNNAGTELGVIIGGVGATRGAVQYRVAGTATWTETPATSDSLNLLRAALNLRACTPYEIRTYIVCNGTTSDFSASQIYTTRGCAGADSCNAPLRVMGIVRDSGLSIFWSTSNISSGSFAIQYRVASSTTWQELSSTRPNVTLTGLAACTFYEVRVRTNCSASNSNYSSIIRLKTGGCATPCNTPAVLRVVSTANGATFNVSWVATAPNALYQVQYRVVGDTSWQTLATRSTVLSIGGVRTCTPYQFRVRVRCGDNIYSAYSSIFTQTSIGCSTSRCNAPRITGIRTSGTNSVYITWDSLNATASAIVRYRLVGDTTWQNLTVTSRLGTLLSNLTPCSRYEVQARTVCSSTSSSNWSNSMIVATPCQTACVAPVGLVASASDAAVVLAWRGNATAYNLQYKRTNDSAWQTVRTTTPQYQLLNLTPCTVYSYRVQSVCGNTTSDWSNWVRFETRGCTNPSGCAAPRNVVAQLANDSMAFVSWQGTFAAIPVRYRVVIRGMGIVQELTADTSFMVVDVPMCGTYTVTVRTICTSGNSDWTAPVTFTTNCGGGTTCAPMVNVIATSTPTTTTLTWQASNDGSYYSYRYYRTGDSSSLVWDTTRNTTVVLSNLVPCATYTAIVQRFCTNGSTSSATVTFRVYGPNCLQGGSSSEVARNFQIFPNPSEGSVNIAYELERNADVTIDFVNLQGQKLLSIDSGRQVAGEIRQNIEAAANLQNGVYFINLRADGQLVKTLKFFKQ